MNLQISACSLWPVSGTRCNAYEQKLDEVLPGVIHTSCQTQAKLTSVHSDDQHALCLGVVEHGGNVTVVQWIATAKLLFMAYGLNVAPGCDSEVQPVMSLSISV